MSTSANRLHPNPSSLTPITHTTATATGTGTASTESTSTSTTGIPSYGHQYNVIVPLVEAESIIQSLHAFPIHEIGCSPFLQMYGYQVERLSMQAHISAQTDNDEYIVDALLTYQKVPILVEMLLALEAWRMMILRGRDGNGNGNGNETDQSNDESNEHENEFGSNENNKSSSKSGLSSSIMAKQLAKNKSPLRCAFILHVETTLVSILNLILYRREHLLDLGGQENGSSSSSSSSSSSGNDVMIALVDYCARQMSSLAAPLAYNDMVRHQKNPQSIQQLQQHIHNHGDSSSDNNNNNNNSTLNEMYTNLLSTEYKTAIMATSLARHLCEHIDYLSLGVQARILDTHDYLILFVPLVEEPPWTRRRKITVPVPGKGKGKGKTKDGERASTSTSTSTEWIWEKLNQNREWTHTPPSTLLHLTQCEAQCWLAIFHLTCSKACRENRGTYHGYSWNTHRKHTLLKLRKYLGGGGNGNDMLTDQLPILKDVMVFMDQLAIMNVPEHGTGSDSTNNNSGLLLEQVDRMREKIVSTMVKGRHDGGSMYASIFQKGNGNGNGNGHLTDATDMDLRLIAEIYNADMLGIGGGGGGGAGDGVSSTSTGASASASASTTTGANLEATKYAMSAPLKVIEIKSQFIGMGTGSGRDEGSRTICTVYNLTPANEGQVLQTEHGEFRRTKLKLHAVDTDSNVDADADADVVVEENDDGGYDVSTGDEKNNNGLSSSSSHHFFNNASIQARLSFDGFVNLKTLTSERMNLVNDDGNDNDNDNDENITSKAKVNAMKWFQLGTAEEGIVLQLGFKKVFASNNQHEKVGSDSLPRFELRQGFLSQPHLQS